MPRSRHSGPTSIAEVFGGLRADYDAARPSRFRRTRTGTAGAGSNADYHYRSEGDYLRLMEFARDLDRNDPIIGQGVSRLVNNVLQDGFALDVKTGDDATDLYLWQRWQNWSSDPRLCHAAKLYDFNHLAWLGLRAMLVDGDHFFLPLRSGSLQAVEAHRCRTPSSTKRNCIHGILKDETTGEPLEYWFTKRDMDPNRAVKLVGDIERYPAFDRDGNPLVLHLRNPKRMSQTRGITPFAPIADTSGMYGDLAFAKLVQAQAASCFAILREFDINSDAPGDTQFGERTETARDDGSLMTEEGFAPGMVYRGVRGETLKGFSPAIPNPEFFQHALLILTTIAVNLDLPVAVLLLDPRQTNFSGWRGAIDQSRHGFRFLQCLVMIAQFHRQVYQWKVRQWLAESADLRAMQGRPGINVFGHEWKPRTWAYIEPLKDAQADLCRFRNPLESPRRLFGERGSDWETIAEEIVADRAYAIRKALAESEKINTEFPQNTVRITWRDLMPLPVPDGVSTKLGEDPAAALEAEEQARKEADSAAA